MAGQEFLGSIISYDQEAPIFLAAQDRSVLSSQNDMVRILKAQIADPAMHYDFILMHLNIIPHTKKGVMDNAERRVEQLIQTSRGNSP